MGDPRAWLEELSAAAPRVDRALLRIIARLLASDADIDTLLIVSDALREASAEATLDGRHRLGADLIAVDTALAGEAAIRSRVGAFW